MAGRSFALWSDSVFVAFERPGLAFRLDAIWRPLEVVTGIVLLSLGGGATAVLANHAVSWWLQAAHGLVLVRRRIHPARPRFGLREAGGIMREGLPALVVATALTWLTAGPLALVRHLADGMGTTGQFALDLQAMQVLAMAPIVLATSSLPALSRKAAVASSKNRRYLEVLLAGAILGGALAGLAGEILGPAVVTGIFGPEYGRAGEWLGRTLLLLAPLASVTALFPILFADGRFHFAAACAVVGSAVLAILGPALFPTLGTDGILIAAGAGLAAWAILMGIGAHRSVAFRVGRSVIAPLLLAAAAWAIYLAVA